MLLIAYQVKLQNLQIRLSPYNISQYQVWYVSLIVENYLSNIQINGQLNVMASSILQCSNICNRIQSQCSLNSNQCQCQSPQTGFLNFGRDCDISVQQLQYNNEKQIKIQGNQISYFYFDILNNQQSLNIILNKQNANYLSVYINQQQSISYMSYPANPNYNDFGTYMTSNILNIKISSNYFQDQITSNKRLFITIQNSFISSNSLSILLSEMGNNSYNPNGSDQSYSNSLFIVYIVVILISAFICLFICIKSQSYFRSRNSHYRRNIVNPVDELLQIDDYLPTYSFQDVKQYIFDTGQEELTDCIICLETFLDNDNVKITPCYHVYHCECIKSWLIKNQNCPFCRFTLDKKTLSEQQNIQLVPKPQRNAKQPLINESENVNPNSSIINQINVSNYNSHNNNQNNNNNNQNNNQNSLNNNNNQQMNVRIWGRPNNPLNIYIQQNQNQNL